MIKRLLLFLFLCHFLSSKAQTNVYHPLPNDSLVWLQSWQDSDGYMHYYVNEMLGDTTIGIHAYKKLFMSSYTTSPLYTPPIPVYYSGAVRQDIPGKKIYRMDAAGTETLLYDFNKVVGDTLAFVHFPTEDTLYVSSVDSILIGTQYHKMFHVANSPYSGIPGNFTSSWVEGMGNLAGFGNYYSEGFESAYNLLCFSANNVKLYPAGSSDQCLLSVGIIEIAKNNFKISVSPNPAVNEVNLRISCREHYNVEIRDVSWKRWMQKTDQSAAELAFDIENYPPGIYFIRIGDAKGNVATKKIVKQ